MKVSGRLVLKIILAFVIACAIVSILPYLLLFSTLAMNAKKAREAQVRLLSETDYKVLLDSCRALSKRVASGDLKAGDYFVRGDLDPNASQLPQLILKIEPLYVSIDTSGTVTLELLGGPEASGVVAFPEGCEGYGERKLINGLWYYDHHYGQYPEYQERIEGLIQKGKRAQRIEN